METPLTGTRDFNCKGMTGFTFKYPVGIGGNPTVTNASEWVCDILFLPDDSTISTFIIPGTFPQITVEKVIYDGTPSFSSPGFLKNPHGVAFNKAILDSTVPRANNATSYQFYGEGYVVQITYIPIISDNTHRVQTISEDAVWETITNSFQFTSSH